MNAARPTRPKKKIPQRTRKPYSAPRKGKRSMTIVAGFCCTDGIVLCADTQITVPGSMKYPESKIRMTPSLRSEPFFAFCDDMDYQKQCIPHFGAAIQNAEQQKTSIIAALEGKAIELHQTYYDLYVEPSEKLNANMLVSLRLDGQRKLLRVNGPRVAPVEMLECIGAGNYLARSLAGTYWSDDRSMRETSLICAYMLADVKRYVDGCGGDSHIIQLDHSGSWKRFPAEDDYQQIEDIEQAYRDWQYRMGPLMIDFQDFQRSQINFECDLHDACEELIAQRKPKAAMHEEIERTKLEREIAESLKKRTDEGA